MGVTRLTFFAVLGAILERGESYLEVFRVFRPGIDQADVRKLLPGGHVEWRLPDDLYPDALPALAAVRDAGYRVGIVGNQPPSVEAAFAALELDVDLLASSASWGVMKPDPAFFERISTELGLPPPEIAYVGDRIDNDVIPAARAGMVAVWIRRGPWAWVHAGLGTPPEATISVESLLDIPDALARLA
jgi:FMN phosphatase YigB (HAD superfamily)